MAYLDDLIAARDDYAQRLAAQASLGEPDTRWNEYENFLLDQIKRLDEQIAAAKLAALADEAEVVSGAYT